MRRINILPLLVEHADELAEQQRELFQSGAIDSVAFSFTLVPEGIPPLDKAGECTRRFRVFQEKLRPLGIPCGILLQATWGHGWTPDEPTDFQRIVRLDGTTQYTMCPEDERFREYIAQAVFTAASARPDFMMLDDDTRFITGRNACFCPLHTTLYNHEYGQSWRADELREAVAHDEETARQMDAVLQKSMQRYARLVRDAIDRVNPQLPCSFCLCAEDVRHAPAVARILAGEGREMVVRINNARYLRDSLRTMPQWLYDTARQVASLPSEAVVLCEPDTCPQNRYSTSAAMLLAHQLLSAMEGCSGAKLWITRLGQFEPKSGQAYREALRQNAGMLQTVFELHPVWQGIRIPLPAEPPFNFPPRPVASGWHEVLARMGLPMHFGKGSAPCLALGKEQIETRNDEELRYLLQSNLLLDGGAIETLTRRGLAQLCGCEGHSWELPHVSFERLLDGTTMAAAGQYARLNPLADNAEVASVLCHRAYAFSPTDSELAPGTVITRRQDGTCVTVIANWLGGEWFNAFGMFNETRKTQLVSLLNRLAPMPVWYPEDAELFLKAGLLPDDTHIVVIANFGLDHQQEIPLCGAWMDAYNCVQRMQGDGSWAPLPLRRQAERFILETSLLPLEVAILRISCGVS